MADVQRVSNGGRKVGVASLCGILRGVLQRLPIYYYAHLKQSLEQPS